MHGSVPAAQGEQGDGVHGAGSKRMLYMEQGEREWCTWNRERRDGVHGTGRDGVHGAG